MSYKYSKGNQIIGDLSGSDDSNRDTGIDFEENYISLRANNNDVLVVSGSNVGIGTASPGTNLVVAGDDARIRIDGDTNSHPGYELSENGTRKWIVYNDYSNDNLTFKTNSDARMVIEQDGNVGIGVSDPDSLLELFSTSTQLKLSYDANDSVTFAVDSSGDLTITPSATTGDKNVFIKGDLIIRDNDESKHLVQIYDSSDDGVIAGYANNSITTLIHANGETYFNGGKVGIGTASPTSILHVNGAIAKPIITKTSAYTITEDDSTILVDASSGTVTITLPAASGISGRIYTIKCINSTNNATIASNGSELIDGSASNISLSQWDSYTLQNNGTSLFKIGYVQGPPP